MASHLELGKKGELIAQHYLTAQHYQLLHINWRCGRREVDIIACTPDCLVFVEVKTLASDQYGWPEDHVDAQKIRLLQSAADVYLEKMAVLPKEIRFDIIAITFRDNGQYELLHMEDAF